MSAAKAVLLVGSPRGAKSASRSLGLRLLEGLGSRGWDVQSHSIYAAFDAPEKDAALLEAALSADLLLFSFPLYVDQLPAPVIRTLDRLAEARWGRAAASKPRLAALVQSGFPETHQNAFALDVMRRFAETQGFDWAGGMPLGMGGAASGRPLPEKPAGLLRNVVTALDRAAEALAAGGPIPGEVTDLLAKPLMPKKLYFLGANWGWRQQARVNARKSGQDVDLRATPYRPAE